jgi:cell division protein ZapA (FtsZ GTPase activity inhibitor)
MRNLKVAVAIFVMIFFINGCEDSKKEPKDIKNSQKVTQNRISNAEGGDIVKIDENKQPLILKRDKDIDDAKKEKKILNKIGISANGQKITIDINKTKSFLDSITKIIDKKAKKIENKTKNLDSKDLGIEIDNDKVEIDLKKSKKFLNDFSKELNGMVKDIDKEINK